MGYKHGIYTYEAPSSIVPPVRVDSALPVFFVTAPVHLTEKPYENTNVPQLIFDYSEAVSLFGFSLKNSLFHAYTSCEVIYSQFALYACAPIVMINVLNPTIHNTNVTDKSVPLGGKTIVVLVDDGILLDTVVLKKGTAAIAKSDYTLAFDEDGLVNIHLDPVKYQGNEVITASYTKLAPEKVTSLDFIGGYNDATDQYTGLELLNFVYPKFRMVPGQLVVPKYSADPAVAAVMETKAGNINGHFKCIALNDLPSDQRYQDIPGWVKKNNYISSRQYNCYPKIRLEDKIFHLSTQMAGLICRTDSLNFDVPYNSPSNKNLKANGICKANGDAFFLGIEQANYLNGEGIATAINWSNGFVAWGNRTGCYPGITDVKDSFIPLRRMFDWISNTIILTYWNKIDAPLTKRNIQTIVDSINMWFNSLAAREFILGGRIEFFEDDNGVVDLMDGIVKFRVFITPPSPMEQAQFILEYDPQYLQNLFSRT